MELLITLFLAGDVMLGRGVDQILPQSVEAVLYESYVKDARDYVQLAEARHGPIDRPVSFDYVWGEALQVLEKNDPSGRIINLETAVTTHDEPWPGKGIHYRMHPSNVAVLAAAEIDVAVLANNHVLDWERLGLVETVRTLEQADIEPVGAGLSEESAAAPAIISVAGEHRVLVFAYATRDSGVMRGWEATEDLPGVNVLPTLGPWMVDSIAEQVAAHKRAGDMVVFSVHWGGNWGYEIPEDQQRFARWLIDRAGVDIVHGHSSHHAKAIEVYKGRLILYGAGDLINDYEGIGGHEQYRPDLTVMYFPTLDPTSGRLEALRLVAMQLRELQLRRAGAGDVRWLMDRLNRESAPFDTQFQLGPTGDLLLVTSDVESR